MTSVLDIYLKFLFHSYITKNYSFDENKILKNDFTSNYDFNFILNENEAQNKIKFDFLEVDTNANLVLTSLR